MGEENISIEYLEECEQYHTLYRESRKSWTVVPFEEMITWLKNREGYEVGDFGCGEALLAKEIGDLHNVHSLSTHVAKQLFGLSVFFIPPPNQAKTNSVMPKRR